MNTQEDTDDLDRRITHLEYQVEELIDRLRKIEEQVANYNNKVKLDSRINQG